jgi:hypothetical protein
MDAGLAQSMTLETFEGKIDTKILNALGALMLEYEIVVKKPDLDTLVIQ